MGTIINKNRLFNTMVILVGITISTLAYSNEQWELLLKSSNKSSEYQTVEAVNRAINQLRQQPDQITWIRKEYWATPYELLNKGAGDCEDFAVAKYLALLELGIPEDRLQLLWSRAYNSGKGRIESHVVALYRPLNAKEYLVLDNMSPLLTSIIERKDILPQIRFDTRSVWVRENSSEWVISTSHPKLYAWQRVLKKWSKDRYRIFDITALNS